MIRIARMKFTLVKFNINFMMFTLKILIFLTSKFEYKK
jgi:hypothetical protein